MALDPRNGGFFMFTGVTFAGFASGFGVCLFDLSQVDACVSVARHWQDVFMQMGSQVLTWGFAVLNEVMST